jgi:hypothetical protein
MDPQEGSRKPRVTGKRDGPAPVRMRPCLQCGQAGVIWSPTGTLCQACDAAIAAEVQARVRTIQESLRTLQEEPAVAGKLREWDRILAQAAALRQYEVRGILTTCPPPSSLLQQFQAQREALARTG